MIETAEKKQDPPPKGGLFSKLAKGLSKTRNALSYGLNKSLFSDSHKGLDEIIEELEELLIKADMGIHTVTSLMENLRENASKGNVRIGSEVKDFLKERIVDILKQGEGTIPINNASPFVIMVIGVNGSGKTTTIGKLAVKWSNSGKKVLLAAGDTFRAAAIEQLEIWAKRSNSEFVKHSSGTDPSAVIYDAIQAAQARKCDLLLADTAGRLQNNPNLLEELKKIKRVMGKVYPGAPHETMLVIDSTNGQNAISQAKQFYKDIGVTSLVVTKLDGSAKGGTIVQIIQELKLPIRYIATGEKTEDLQPFDPREYAEALFA